MTSHLPPLVQATAGSLGAVVSGALVFPADTLVKRNQVKRSARRRPTERAQEASRLGRPVKANHPKVGAFEAVVHTLKTEGLLSLYSGLVPDSLSTLLSQFLYFLCYTALRTRLVKRKQRLQPQAPASQSAKKAAAILLSPLEELGIGCLAGVVAKGIVSPLSMITVRAQTSRQPKQDVVGGRPGDKSPVDPAARTEKRPDDSDSDESDDGYSSAPSTLDLAREIYDEQGLAGFWSGFSSTVILTINPAITFYVFAALKRALIPAKHRHHPTPTQTFLCGALASAFATGLTYPLILAKTRLQFKAPTGRAMYRNLLDVFRKSFKRNGVAGLYQGVESKILLGFFSEGVKLLFKDRIELLIVLAYRALVARQSKELA
ncbi:hypothetical protein C6P46_001700 [Rhodotorula mucilaginosa]|uniref:Mitochondrial carrier n=1 Tax=Rhodotorula mucilaginosa TaxID=5537 RepID=A0A9P6W7E9_RHOMI|nr:hypothetical protein C6P46_001700 [Rhodotorula mucilaginosa]